MEQQIIALVNQHIAQLFVTTKNSLLHSESYRYPVETKHLFDYFRFLETALQKPYNRMVSLNAFLNNSQGLLSHQMYPLNALKPAVKEQITTTCDRIVQLANALDMGGIDPAVQTLCKESHDNDEKQMEVTKL